MNTKKITALALAALMAAGSTSTAFAVSVDTNKNQALVFDGTTAYEEDDNGVLVEDKDGVAPGDSIYFLLKDGAFDDIEDKDRDRIKVYADWKMGKDYIKDIEIVYKKGEAVTSGSAVADSKYYTVKIGGKELKVVVGKGETRKEAIEREIYGAMSDPNFLKDERAKEYESIQDVTTGAVIDGKYVTDTYTEKNSGLVAVDDKYYASASAAKDALFASAASLPKLWVLTADDNENIQHASKASTTPGVEYTDKDGEKSNYTYRDVKGDDILVIPTSKASQVADADLLKHNLATAVTSDAILVHKDDSTFAWKDDKNYVVSAQAPAYEYASTKYVTKAEAKDAADHAIAAAEATELDGKTRVVSVDSDIDSVAKPDFTYWVKIDTKESFTTKEQDIAGTLYLGTSKNSAEDKGSKLEIGLPLSNRIDDNHGSYVIKDGDTIYPDANGAVKFEDDAEEVTIYFGSNEDAWFTFNAAGQSALNLAYNTKFNKEIADLFPKANIDFISWIATPAANRTGDLYITANEDTFLYQVTEDGKGIKEVKGADCDENEGAWHIRTRKLGSYVISDMELDTTAKVEDKDEASSNSSTSSKPNGDKHNPDTGR